MIKHTAKWRLDRRVPLTVLVALLVQFAAAIVWATQLDARVDMIERHAMDGSGLSVRFARLEERLEFLKQDMSFLKTQLDQLNQHLLRLR